MPDRPGLLDMLGQTWPARMAKSAWEAAKLPGDVYAGRVDPLSDEGIGRAADLGGMVMGGTYAGAPRGAMGAGAVKPIRAYHGSPHDFERFDLSKIGTGEGAQAYGHGLYFAENPGVAQIYRDNLARPSFNETKSGVPISSDVSRILEDAYNDAMKIHGVRSPSGNDAVHLAQQNLERQRADALKAKDFDWYSKIADQQAELARMGSDAPKHGGKMYEVNINAAPEQFLDWDKPLAQMSPEVQQRLKDAWLAHPEGHSRQLGSQIYEASGGQSGMVGRDASTWASRTLEDAGIPGIKYLDQGSRGVPTSNGRVQAIGGKFHIVDDFGTQAGPFDTLAEAKQYLKPEGNQTSNYVLFRDDIIDIVKKYGLATAAAMYGISQDEAKAAMDDKPKTKIGRQNYANEE